MRCPRCGVDNPAKNKFCGECGFPLKQPIDKGRVEMVKQEIPESLVKKILYVRDTIEKEHRDVSVVFADISGFTSISESLDPEELTELMNKCFRKLGKMVYRYEGIIDKFIGDCVMAIFGAPIAHEDDPERAVLACLDMQNAIEEINAGLDKSLKRLQIHSGINTGKVIAGKVGSDLQMEYTVMGDTVNVAQRLKDQAPPGSILVGPETYRRTKHAFDFMPLEPMRLKGKAAMVKPFEVIGKKWGSEFGLSIVHSDLIGRNQELSLLKQGYDDLIKGRSSILIIKGEIGVGKSRLLYEFRKYLTIYAPEGAIIYGRGFSYESAIPFKSILDSLHRFLIEENVSSREEDKKIIKEKLVALMEEEGVEVLPYLYKFFNIELTEAQKEKVRHLDSHSLQLQIFLAIATLLEKLSDKKPIIFIFDDIQWFDSASIELLNFLLPLIKKRRISFCLSYRLGDLSAITNLLKNIKDEYPDYTKEIPLKNLSPEDSMLLIENLMGKDVDEGLKRYIIEKSQGNPFFIEEIARNILESEAYKKGKGLTRKQIEIPGSIEAAVSSRIDGLNKEAKYLLKIASIIGRNFPETLLEELIKDRDIYQNINELEQTEILVRINKDNETYYAFRHPIFQEVTYHSILKSERVIYHKVIAETIEQKFTDRLEGISSILAHHYYYAGNTDKALSYSIKAGDEASALYANDEALLYYNQALEVATTEDVKVKILKEIADIELITGKVQSALKHFEEARNLTRDRSLKAQLSEKIARVLEQTGKIDEAIQLMNQAITSLEGEDSPGFVSLCYSLSNILLESKAEIERAVTLVDKGLATAERLNDEALRAEGLRAKAHILWRQGKNEDALSSIKEASSIYEQLSNKRVQPFIFLLTAAIYRASGDLNSAIRYVEKGIERASEIGHKRVLAMCYNNLGAYYAYLGDYKLSIEATKKNVEIRRQLGDKKGEAIGLSNIGLTYKYLGEFDNVLGYLKQASDIFEEINDIRSLINNYQMIGDFLFIMGQKSEAQNYFEKAYNLARNVADQGLLGTVLYRYGVYHQDLGDSKKARELYEKALPLLTAVEDKHYQSELYFSLADLLIKENNPEALKYARDGLRLARESGMKTGEIGGLRILGRAQALLDNDFNQGIKNIKRSIAIAQEIGAVAQSGHSFFALAEVLRASGRSEEALQYLHRAEKIYKQLKAKHWLEQVVELKAKFSS